MNLTFLPAMATFLTGLRSLLIKCVLSSRAQLYRNEHEGYIGENNGYCHQDSS